MESLVYNICLQCAVKNIHNDCRVLKKEKAGLKGKVEPLPRIEVPVHGEFVCPRSL